MRLLLVMASVVALASCDEKVTGPTAALNAEFTLAPGELAAIDTAGLSIRFNGIAGDNRCPADAVCVLGGSADVSITVISGVSGASGQSGTRPSDYVLRTGDMRPVRHEGFTISLVQVSPYPFSARPIAPGDYRATLAVAR